MKVLVTGAGGFLGSALVAELKKRGHSVRAVMRRRESAFNLHGLEVEIFICDIQDKEAVASAVKGVDVIFHTAAVYRSYPFYVLRPKEIFETNIRGTRNVFEEAIKAGVKRIVYTSSTGAVGKRNDGLPADESVKLNLLEKRSFYERSKALAEEAALSYSDKGIEVVSVNPSFLFGTGDSRPTPTGEMIVKFLNRVYPTYFDATLCVSDIRTVVEAEIKAMEKGKNGERYIVAHERHYTLKELFDLLEGITGIKGPRLKMPLQAVWVFSILNELVLLLTGLSRKAHPIVESEVVKYFGIGSKYDGAKAKKDLGLKDADFRETLKDEVRWYVRNGYIRRSSKIRYFKTIGKL
jgi:dihydroflavonol-4-reductase